MIQTPPPLSAQGTVHPDHGHRYAYIPPIKIDQGTIQVRIS